MPTLAEFERTTTLQPRQIAGVVSNDDPAFCAWAEARTLHLYDVSPSWRTLMHSENRRNWLTTFMTNWWHTQRQTLRNTP